MYSIGKFSLMTGISVKRLRRYHEEGLLLPDFVDEDSGYRYYGELAADRARIIQRLRELEFPLGSISEILDRHTGDEQLLALLDKRRRELEESLKKYDRLKKEIEGIMALAAGGGAKKENTAREITEKILPDGLFLGRRLRGDYSRMGEAVSRAARLAGRRARGRPLGLFYDEEYREGDADFEGGFFVTEEIAGENLSCRVLSGGRALCLSHVGPYGDIGRTYEELFRRAAEKKLKTRLPFREVYLRGPGMIFKGNPDKYQTEVQILVEE